MPHAPRPRPGRLSRCGEDVARVVARTRPEEQAPAPWDQCSPGKAAVSAGVCEQAALHTGDERAEVGLLLAQPGLEVAQVLLPRLDLVLAEIRVGLEASFALVELGLAALELERALLDLLVLLLEPLRAPLEPFGRDEALAEEILVLVLRRRHGGRSRDGR